MGYEAPGVYKAAGRAPCASECERGHSREEPNGGHAGEPNGVSGPPSHLSKAAEQPREMSLCCLAAPCQSWTENALRLWVSSTHLHNPLSFWGCPWLLLSYKKSFTKQSFQCMEKYLCFNSSYSTNPALALRGEIFLARLLCPSLPRLKAPGTLQHLHFVSLRCPSPSTCAEFPSIWLSLISICWKLNASLIWEINHT